MKVLKYLGLNLASFIVGIVSYVTSLFALDYLISLIFKVEILQTSINVFNALVFRYTGVIGDILFYVPALLSIVLAYLIIHKLKGVNVGFILVLLLQAFISFYTVYFYFKTMVTINLIDALSFGVLGLGCLAYIFFSVYSSISKDK